MKLSAEQIKSVITGAAYFCEDDGKVNPLRFSKEQQEFFLGGEVKAFYTRTFSSAGIKAEFITDSSNITLETEMDQGSSRTWFSFDIRVNGDLIHTIHGDLKDADGNIEKKIIKETVSLGEGEKKVTLYFPWSVKTNIISLELDDNSYITPAPRKLKMLTYGDSITHGYDAKNPSLSYASIIADTFDADACNKAIGGEIFRPALAAMPENFTPDVITVAYGTNDFSKCTKEEFDNNSTEFYNTLARLYPTAKIISLAPIYRTDYQKKPEKFGEPFDYVLYRLREIAKDIPQMTVIDCFDFLPKTQDVFQDLRIHPNNTGFDYYAKGVIAEIRKLGIL